MRRGSRNTWREIAGWVLWILVPGLPGCNAPTSPTSSPSPVTPHATSSKTTPKAALEVAGDRLGNAAATKFVLSPQTESSPYRFAEVAQQAGIEFVHFSGMTSERRFPTANGSGVALFDYDGDGKLDIYFATQTRIPLGSARSGPNRLYKNLGNWKFRDVTESSGLGFAGFCHGIVVGDIDNDGDPDVFLANYGPNALFLNNGDGSFRDISKAAGIDRPNWSSGGAFLDYDNDGDLDLFLANYGEWVYPRDDVFCGNKERGVRLYCSPTSVRTAKPLLYRNNGDLTFTDVTDAAGVGRTDGHGFGVVAADIDADGAIDLFVANDMKPNFLFRNRRDGTFEDASESSGAAFNERGSALSGMGVDAEDINGDGLPELHVTNFTNEYNTLYLNLGQGNFMDSTSYFGLAADTLPFVGWGCALADFDSDGWPDNFVTNGHVDDNRHELGQDVEYAEPPLLFHNLRGRRFQLATRDVGPYFGAKHVGRGAAFGDIDNDGDIDIVVSHKDGPPALLRNDTKTTNRWIRFELEGTRSNRDGVGAKIEVVIPRTAIDVPDAPSSQPEKSEPSTTFTIHRQRKGGASMESANDPRVLIGVGRADEAIQVSVRWPSGKVTVHPHLATNRSHKIVEPR